MDTTAIKHQADAVYQLQQALALAQQDIQRAEGKFGQDTSLVITINGVSFQPVMLGRNHMPEVRQGMETMQREAVRLLRLRCDDLRSRLDGAQWKLRQLVKVA